MKSSSFWFSFRVCFFYTRKKRRKEKKNISNRAVHQQVHVDIISTVKHIEPSAHSAHSVNVGWSTKLWFKQNKKKMALCTTSTSLSFNIIYK